MRGVTYAFVTTVLWALVASQTQRSCPIDLLMVVDRSGSIAKDYPDGPRTENWEAVKDFLINVTDPLDIGQNEGQSRVGLIAYNNNAQREFDWNIQQPAVRTQLRDLSYPYTTGGKTNTREALEKSIDLFDELPPRSVSVPKILLLVTDGGTSAEYVNGLFGVADTLKNSGVRIVGVGVTDRINEPELMQLVSNPENDYFTVSDFLALQEFTEEILNSVCELDPVCDSCCDLTCATYETGRQCYDECPDSCKASLLCPAGEVRLSGGRCGDPRFCEQECGEDCRIDLMLMVDVSGSIGKDSLDEGGPDYWARDMRPFLRNLIIALDIGPDMTHVGMIIFSDASSVEFDMNDFMTKDEMLEYIDNLYCPCYDGGFTNTSGALWTCRQVFNQPGSGDRPDVDNVALLITDGEDNRDEDRLVPEARELEKIAKIMAVGVSPDVDDERLLSILTSRADYFNVTEFDNLREFLYDIIEQTCNLCPPTCSEVCCNLTCGSLDGRPCYDSCPSECQDILCPMGMIQLPDGRCGEPSECSDDCDDDCVIDLIILLDESGSIGIDSTREGGPDYYREDIRPFVIDLITGLNIGADQTRVGLVTFNNDAVVRFDLNDIFDKEEMRQFILDMNCRCDDGGNTNTSGGIRQSRVLLETASSGNRPGVPDIVLLITDGQDNVDTRYLRPEALRLEQNARLLALGVSEDVLADRLKAILVNENDYFDVDDFDALPAILNDVIAQTCNVCPVDPCDECCDITCDTLVGRDCATECPNECRVNSGLCPNNMPVRLSNGQCGTPSMCTDVCGDECQIDLLLCVDESGSIAKDSIEKGGPDFWARDLQPFIENLIIGLPIGPGQANVGLLMYSNQARVVFDLNEYMDIPSMQQRIDDIDCNCYDGGATNTSGCLYLARQVLNTPGMGNRPGVPNMVLLVTDGQDNVDGAFLTREARLLEREARLMAIAVGDDVNRPRLESILVNPATDYLDVEEFDELGNELDEALQQTCNLCPPDPCDLCCDLTCDTLPSGRDCYQDCPLSCSEAVCPRNRPVRLRSGLCGTPAQCQPIECVEEVQDCRIDLLLILDESGSIGVDSTRDGGPDFWDRDVRPFVKNMITNLNVGMDDTRVATIMYNDFTQLEFDFDDIDNKADMRDYFDDLHCRCYDGGYTNTSGALWFGKELLEDPTSGNRPDVIDVVVLVTDGLDNKGANRLDQEAIALTRVADVFLVVGVSEEVNRKRLEGIVVNPATDFFMVAEFDELSRALDDIIVRTCNLCVDECEDCCNITCSTLEGRECYDSCPENCREEVLCPANSPVRLDNGQCGIADQCPPEDCTEDEECKIDLIVVVDESGSVAIDSMKIGGPNYWEEDMRPFLRELYRGLNIGMDRTRVAQIMYSNDARMNFDFNAYSTSSQVVNYIDSVNCRCMDGGWTNSSGALAESKAILERPDTGNRPDVPDVTLFITDGQDNLDRTKLHANARQLEAISKVIAIGVSEKVDRPRLESILVNPNDDYFHVDQFEQLSQVLDDVIRQSCNICPKPCEELCCNLTCSRLENNKCFDECPTECRDRLCPADMPVQLPGGGCGVADECPASVCDADCRIDLTLIIDQSGSIARDSLDMGGPDYWARDMRPFIMDIVGGLTIGQDETHVAMITYGNNAEMRFSFTEFMQKDAMMNRIENDYCTCYDGGFTNTSGALWLGRETLDNPVFGNRPEVPDVVLLITDGKDNLDRINFKANARLLQNQARLIVVGVSEDVDQDRLTAVLDDPVNDYFFVSQFDELRGIIDDVIASTCGQCPCPEPTPIENVFAFHSYSMSQNLILNGGDTIVFEGVYTNIGNDYDSTTGVYTCPCTGLYLFMHSYNGVGCSLATVIMMDDQAVSTVATVDYHGTLSTSAVTTCRAGQRVYVRVLEYHGRDADFTYLDMSKIYFQGYMIHALDLS